MNRSSISSPMPDIANTPPPPKAGEKELRPSEATTLKDAFIKAVSEDSRCVGLSRYINNVRIFWSHQIPTACAGHGFIFFNPDFYDRIPAETRITVMVHEVWHLILKHLERGKNCDPYIHNEAADHVINNGLEDDGFTFNGTNPMKDPKFRGQSTEQVYNTIYQDKKNNPPPKKQMGIPDGHIPAELIEDLIEQIVEEEGSDLEKQKEKADKDVENFGKNPGRDAGSVLIHLHASSQKTMIIGAKYQDIFSEYLIDPLSGGKRTFMRPNRRQHAMRSQKLMLPGRYPKRGHENRLTHLVYALDVSGSINSKQAQQFHNSVRTIKELLNPEKLTVLFFDTRIVLEKTFTDREPYGNISVRAGGGTDLRDVYKRTKELQPEALVIFTDMCLSIPPEQDWDTIWLIPETRFSVTHCTYGEVYLIPEPT